MFDEAAFDRLLCAALRQEAAAWPQAWDRPDDPGTALARIEFHGIAGLLLTSPQWLVHWPSRLMAGLHELARSHALWEMAHQHVLTLLLRDLHREGMDALVMKGTALAYSLYDDPAMRPRGDTDLLIRKADLPRAREVLENLGFARPHDWDAVFGVHHLEEIWQFSFRDKSWHDIDLHWSVIAVPALSDILQVDACLAASRPLPRLCPEARAMGPVDSLIRACINRKSHDIGGVTVAGRKVFNGNRLCWAKDFDLLAREFTSADWEAFKTKVLAGGVARICLEGLNSAEHSLGTAIPPDVREALAEAPDETTANRFYEVRRGWVREMLDLQATPGILGKCRFALARAFPSRTVLQVKYPGCTGWPVALLYLRRLIEWSGRVLAGRSD